MEWLVWFIIAILVIIIIVEIVIAIVFRSNYLDCKNSVSPYCPEYTCPNTGVKPSVAGQAAISYSDCVSSGDCVSGLVPPCSLAATSS